MRGIARVVVGLFVAASFIAPAGSAVAAVGTTGLNLAQKVNLQISDLPRGPHGAVMFVAGVNGIEQHDDGTAAHNKAASADDRDYYWKNAGGDHSTEVSTTIEYYRTNAEAVSFMPAGALATAKAEVAKLPADAHTKVQACHFGEVCLYTTAMFYKSPVADIQFRLRNYVVSVFVCESGTNLPVPSIDTLDRSLALKVATKIESAKH